MSDRVQVEDVHWTPCLTEDRSRRLLLLLFGPARQDDLADKSAYRPQHTEGSQRERDGGRGEATG